MSEHEQKDESRTGWLKLDVVPREVTVPAIKETFECQVVVMTQSYKKREMLHE